MDRTELGPNDLPLIVVDAYDIGISQLGVVARDVGKRSWHYFCLTKPVLVDFGDLLIFDKNTFDVFSYRNPHLKYRLQKCALPDIVVKDLNSDHYCCMDDEYEAFYRDGYLRGDQNG